MTSLAKKALNKARCTLGHKRTAFSQRVKSGHVISQSPKVGAIVPAGSAVTLTVSKGKPHKHH
jgi:beta-lactam-binding protein with PASTA domain